jgi:hypothetical protein
MPATDARSRFPIAGFNTFLIPNFCFKRSAIAPLYDQCFAKTAHNMSETFIFHNIKTTPYQSTPLLEELFAQSGPNRFYTVMAGSPEALSG